MVMTASDTVYGTVCNAQQYDQFVQSSANNSSPNITCLTHGETIGLALTTEASLLSSIAVIFILVRIAWNVRWYRKRFPDGDWRLFQRPTDIYMFALFGFDLVLAMGGVFDVRWAHSGIVKTGSYCTGQGILEEIGQLGVALITILLAVHTFVTALWKASVMKFRGVALGLVFLASLFDVLSVGIPASIHHQNYEMPTPYWCWISSPYMGERLGVEYLWMWVGLFSSVTFYLPVYFWTEGRLSIPEDRWWWPKFHKSKFDGKVEYVQRRAALAMLAYPLAYSFIVLPLTITRWLVFNKTFVPPAVLFFGVIILNLSGAVNVALFLIFRPQLLLFTRPDELRQPDIELVPAGNGSTVFPNTGNFQHSPESTSTTAVADY